MFSASGINTAHWRRVELTVLIKNMTLLKVDFHYYVKKRKFRQALESGLKWTAKIAGECLIPAVVVRAIRAALNRKRLGI